MNWTVVPTRATARLAATMMATARREESGAEAAILHLDDLWPDQYPALVGLLLDAAVGRIVEVPELRTPDNCPACEVSHEGAQSWRGLCRSCYDRHRYAGTLDQFAPSKRGPKRSAA